MKGRLAGLKAGDVDLKARDAGLKAGDASWGVCMQGNGGDEEGEAKRR